MCPQVSVIMNCYNSAAYLKEAIDSVIAQTFQDWEIIFWDNQSSDLSAEIVKKYNDPRIKYFYAEQHTILGEARNLAISKASGEWITLLDCDDFWVVNKLQNQMTLANSNPKLGIVYCDMHICDQALKPIRLGSSIYKMRRGNIWLNLLTSRNFIPCPAVMMRKSAIEQVGGFNPSLKYCEEYELFLKIAQTYEADFVDQPLVKYRLHQNNTTGKGTIATTKEVIKTINAIFATIKEKNLKMYLKTYVRVFILYLKLFAQNLSRLVAISN